MIDRVEASYPKPWRNWCILLVKNQIAAWIVDVAV
jgi:hypothetical protein